MLADKLSIRPIITSAKLMKGMSSAEQFQNKTLRSIIKMQHDLLVLYFDNYIITKKVKFDDCSIEEKKLFIQNIFHKDLQFKNELKGLIVGLFTIEEYKEYISMQHDLNKRILTMMKERLLNSWDELSHQNRSK